MANSNLCWHILQKIHSNLFLFLSAKAYFFSMWYILPAGGCVYFIRRLWSLPFALSSAEAMRLSDRPIVCRVSKNAGNWFMPQSTRHSLLNSWWKWDGEIYDIKNIPQLDYERIFTIYVLNVSEGKKPYVIPPHWHATGSWNPSSSKTRN